MNAKLPASLQAEKISDLMIGEECWVVPWAMYADKDCLLWLNSEYSIHYDKKGTAQLKIKRTRSGFIVDISECPNHSWACSGPLYTTYFEGLPVVELKGINNG